MNIETFTLSWSTWFFYLLLGIACYFLLLMLVKLLEKINILGKRQHLILDLLNITSRLYEPIILLILLVGFVFINPFLHGLLITVIFMLTFYPLKNYANGRLFLVTNHLHEKQRIKVNNIEGTIRQLGRLGIALQTQEGLQFINYTTISNDGYLLLEGKKTRRLYHLLISQNEDEETLTLSILKNRFFSCPYIDWSISPKILMDEKNQKDYFARISLREDAHLKSLIALIKEWGYGCQVVSANHSSIEPLNTYHTN